MPAVSVIIPNYNHAPYLKQRIESVLNQTFQDFELIILDDCSKDNSREIIELYRQDTRVTKIIYNEKNSGNTFWQWQRGIKEASGEYIWIAESDDYAETNFLEKLLAYCRENSLNVAFCNSRLVDQSNTFIATGGALLPEIQPETDWSKDHIFEKGESNVLMFCQTCFIYNTSAVLFKKSVMQPAMLNKAVRYFLVGDMYTWCAVGNSEHIGYLGLVLNNFRTHAETARNTIGKSAKYELELFEVFNDIAQLEGNFSKEVKLRIEERIAFSFKMAFVKVKQTPAASLVLNFLIKTIRFPKIPYRLVSDKILRYFNPS